MTSPQPAPRITFHDALMRERARMQMDRRTVADRCGVREETVRRWERGDAIPSRQQFKRLVTMLRRVAPYIPEWGMFADDIVTGADGAAREEYVAFAKQEIERLDRLGADPKPSAVPFNVGLRRVREENEVTQQELAELLELTDSSISQWETDGATPVRVNLAKLYEVLPELKAGVDTGAVRRPQSRDQEVPGPVPGRVRASTIDTALEMALASSEASEKLPKPERPRWNDGAWVAGQTAAFCEDGHQLVPRGTGTRVCVVCGFREEDESNKVNPLPPLHGNTVRHEGCGGSLRQDGELWICDKCRAMFKALSTVTELAEAYGRARLVLSKTKAEHERALSAWIAAQAELKAAEDDAKTSLGLLDLAIAEEETQ